MEKLFLFGPGNELPLTLSGTVRNRYGAYEHWNIQKLKLPVQLALNAVLELRGYEKSTGSWKIRHADRDTYWVPVKKNDAWERERVTVEFTYDIYDLIWKDNPMLSFRETQDGYLLLDLDLTGLNECIDDICETALKHADRFRMKQENSGGR